MGPHGKKEKGGGGTPPGLTTANKGRAVGPGSTKRGRRAPGGVRARRRLAPGPLCRRPTPPSGGAGGRVAGTVSPRTTMLVVGMRGWPLMESGQVTRNLAEAERLRASAGAVRIVSEVQFREALGLERPPEGSGKSLSGEQVCSTL